MFWIILAISFVAAIGVINYLLAVVRAKKNGASVISNVFYIIAQVLISILYLLPVAAVLCYALYVYVKPLTFTEQDWFVKSLIGYFAVIVLIVILGVVFIKTRTYNVYSKDEAFMYAITPRAIISFVGCALGIALMIFGIMNVDMHRVKVVTEQSQIEQYADQKYLSLDISGLENPSDGFQIRTSEKCKTLIITSKPNFFYGRVEISTSAEKVVIDGLSCNNSSGNSVMVFNDEVDISFDNCTINSISLTFLRDGAFNLNSSKINGTLDFRGKTDLRLDSVSSCNCIAVFDDIAKISVGKGHLNGELTFKSDATVSTTLNGGVDCKVTVGSDCESLTLKGNKTSSSPKKDGGGPEVAVQEIILDLTCQERTKDFLINLNNVDLTFKESFEAEFDGKVKIKSVGKNNKMLSENSSCLFDVKHLAISVDGKLNLKGVATDSNTATILSDSIYVNGKGDLFVYGADGADDGYGGGNAVVSKTMACEGVLNLYFYGGNGGVGRTGNQGYNGYKGAKGNNESQDKDPVYGYNGRPGGNGGKGYQGYQGGQGAAAVVLDSEPVFSDGCNLYFYGGNGGQGGRGGLGGRGGDGGDGGDDDQFSIFWIEDMSGGEGGPGGQGGEGGDGGIGGQGATSLIIGGSAYTIDSSAVTQTDGTVGANGQQGLKGSNGNKGAHGDGGAGG